MGTLGHFHRLQARRDHLEAQLLLHEERRCFGHEDMEDGTASELRSEICELTSQIYEMRHKGADMRRY
jgi:hypothetical protein